MCASLCMCAVCMCMCAVCMCACVHMCTCTCMCICAHAHVCSCLHVCTCACEFMWYVHVCACVHVCMLIPVYINERKCASFRYIAAVGWDKRVNLFAVREHCNTLLLTHSIIYEYLPHTCIILQRIFVTPLFQHRTQGSQRLRCRGR